MIKDVAFDFRVDGKSLKGSAHLDVWPGDAAITDGTIEGDRISFTVVGKIPSTTGMPMTVAVSVVALHSWRLSPDFV